MLLRGPSSAAGEAEVRCRVRVSGLRLAAGAGPPDVIAAALRKAGLALEAVLGQEISRRAEDRRAGRAVTTWSVDFELAEPPARLRAGVRLLRDPPPSRRTATERLPSPAVVVGTGPAGLFAGLALARAGFRPVLLERGDPLNLRAQAIARLNREGVLDPESNYLFGEGGAGTFSDGKLTCRSRDRRVAGVLREFRDRSGRPDVAYDWRPHLGSDRIRAVVARLRTEILARGGTIRYRERLRGLRPGPESTWILDTTGGGLAAGVVVLAPGHSARDLVEPLLSAGLRAEARPFQLGFRVEHPQAWVDGALRRTGGLPADYRLLVRVEGASVFTFCMCPGGEIIPAISDLAHMNTNGMSWSGKSSGFATSGVVTTLDPCTLPGDGIRRGLEFQIAIEEEAARRAGCGVRVPAMRLADLVRGDRDRPLPAATSCRTGLVRAPLVGLFPARLEALLLRGLEGMDRQMPGFLQDCAVVVGPECRSASPLRWRRDPRTLMAEGAPGVFCAGEGAGYAGGIVSAAVDGLRVAEQIMARFIPAP
jgi:uncharacterized FAD-dependent dehydrogenase